MMSKYVVDLDGREMKKHFGHAGKEVGKGAEQDGHWLVEDEAKALRCLVARVVLKVLEALCLGIV